MAEMSPAESLRRELAAGGPKRTAALIPLTLNENVKLQATTPQTIRRNLEGRG